MLEENRTTDNHNLIILFADNARTNRVLEKDITKGRLSLQQYIADNGNSYVTICCQEEFSSFSDPTTRTQKRDDTHYYTPIKVYFKGVMQKGFCLFDPHLVPI